MTLNSSPVSPTDDALAAQYNNLRKDVIIQAGEYVTSGGSANAQTFTIDAQITEYVEGMLIPFKAGYTNTGAATGNVNAIGAKDIKHTDGSALSAGDIVSGQQYELRYNGTNLVLMAEIKPKFGGTGADGALNVTSGTTTLNLGQVYNYTTINVSAGATLTFTGTGAALLNAT
jgi:hypothetical protein